MTQEKPVKSEPWWRYGHVWLVISGPAIVIVAGFVTLYLAIRSPNEIVSDHDVETMTAKNGKLIPGSVAPALQARNHAATGVVPVSK